VELGMDLEGKALVEGPWAARTVGLDGVRSEIARGIMVALAEQLS
jgi:hypothetical protein